MKALLAIVALFSLSLRQDLSSPEATVKSFFAAIKKGDLVTAAKHLHEVTPSANLEALGKDIGAAAPNLVLEGIISTPTGENRVLLKGKLVATMQGSDRKEEQPAEVELIKVGEEWKILVPKDASANSSNMMTSIISFVASPDEVVAGAKKAAKKAACISNIKQMALAAIMYAADHDDILKLSNATLRAKLEPYTKNSSIFTCPLDEPGTLSYSLNGLVAGKSETAIEKPAETVLFYEGTNGALNYKHEGMAMVAFTDGHVKGFKKESAKMLVWKP
jgi:prepilin-type processing-associated H-X9-DG protein